MKLTQTINSAFCFELELGTHFDKNFRENQAGVWHRFCLWPLIAHQEGVSYKPIISWALSLSLYRYKQVCRTNLETLWSKLWNLLRMKLTTDVTLPFLVEVNNDIFGDFHVTVVDYKINSIKKVLLY